MYTQATSKLGEVYEGANISALDWCDVPSRPRARIWLPAPIKAPEDILFMLQECNPYLPTKDWKVIKVEEHEGDVNQAVLVLNKESVAPIETARGVLNFGFSAILGSKESIGCKHESLSTEITFLKKSVNFLGCIDTGYGATTDPEKRKAVKEFP